MEENPLKYRLPVLSESENISSQCPTGLLIFGTAHELNKGTTVDDLREENYDVSGSDTSESDAKGFS